MNKKIDIRFILYQVHNIHELVLENYYKKQYKTSFFFIDYELKKYRYIRENFKNNMKINSSYLDYSIHLDNKYEDVKYGYDLIKKKSDNIKENPSKEMLLKLYIMQLNNIMYFFHIPSSLDYFTRNAVYGIFIFLCKKIKKLDFSFHLEKSESFYLFCLRPFNSR